MTLCDGKPADVCGARGGNVHEAFARVPARVALGNSETHILGGSTRGDTRLCSINHSVASAFVESSSAGASTNRPDDGRHTASRHRRQRMTPMPVPAGTDHLGTIVRYRSTWRSPRAAHITPGKWAQSSGRPERSSAAREPCAFGFARRGTGVGRESRRMLARLPALVDSCRGTGLDAIDAVVSNACAASVAVAGRYGAAADCVASAAEGAAGRGRSKAGPRSTK